VSEEANTAAATGSVLTDLGSVTRGMEPAFEDAVSEVTRVASVAVSFPIIRAGSAGVVVLSRVSAASLLAGMGVGTFSPIV
jgi:hypothetical protein